MRDELHVPWSDECTLIRQTSVQDDEGYETLTETRFPVICTWEDGTSQAEFYRAMKIGMQATASVNIWKADMFDAWPRGTTGKRFVEFNGCRYHVLRDFPVDFDSQTLILSEVTQ